MNRLSRIANRLLERKRVASMTEEAELIQRGFVPSRRGVGKAEVAELISKFDDTGRSGELLIQAKKVPGSVQVVGGDYRVNEPPYIFRYNGRTFDDNLIK